MGGAGPVPLGPRATVAPNVEEHVLSVLTVEKTTNFHDMGIRAETVAALTDLGITRPFPIQEMAIPVALRGDDVIGQARTGTGKTLAFGVPLLERLEPATDPRPQALVVVPTRELCLQVTQDLTAAGSTSGVQVLAIYGGRAYEPQIARLRAGVDVVVGTPGRLLDLVNQRHLRLGGIRVLVLDEADEMLDLGFLPDIERIFAAVPDVRQTMLFSATMPGPIVSLARRFLRRPVHVRAELPQESATVPTTSQHVFRVHHLDKDEVLARILQADGRELAMVFARTKRMADKLAAELRSRGFRTAAVHGDLQQRHREDALRAFRSGSVDVLVATDVAARGLDVQNVTHVINYQCPEDEKMYLHRIGRTGRAGESGVAVTFVDWDEMHRWGLVNTALKLPYPEPVEIYSTSEELFEALDIPASAQGRVSDDRDAVLSAAISADPADERHKRASRQRRRTRGAGAASIVAGPGPEAATAKRRPRQRRRGSAAEPGPAAGPA
ncbi:MAG: DEAD/DEAH box helicase [Frankiaceae bacterium]